MINQLVMDSIVFAVLLVISIAINRRFTTRGYSATAAGGIVMSTGIFSAFTLRALPIYSDMLGRIATLEVIVLWLLIAGSLVQSVYAHGIRMHTTPLLNRFAIGTWVAGTAVLAVLVHISLPELPMLSAVLGIVALIIYLPYVAVFMSGYIALWARFSTQQSTGVILLATVATQSIVIALYTLLGSHLPRQLIDAMVAVDVLFLGSGILLIWLHYLRVKFYDIADSWHNTNCIIHGAVSITGLALTVTSAIDTNGLITIWYVAAGLFVIIEIIEIVRLCQRIYRYGWGRGVWCYDVSQWSRNFTFGMLLAFSMMLAARTGMQVLMLVIHGGMYVVAVLLIIEIVLFVRSRFDFQRS